MSLDNVIAVAAAAKGDILLLVIGLLISIPLVVYGASLLINLINRFPIIIPGGAALIGYIGGEVIITDPALQPWIDANAHWMHEAIPLLGAILIVVSGRIVAPPPAPLVSTVAGEAAGAAALAGGAVLLQVASRILIARAPMIVAFVASAFGYSIAQPGADVEQAAIVSVLSSLKPVLAAVIAIACGEAMAWVVRRMRGAPAHRASTL